MHDPPTPRRGDPLPDDHPLASADTEVPDCIAEVPTEVLDELVAYHSLRGGDAFLGEPVPDDEVLV